VEDTEKAETCFTDREILLAISWGIQVIGNFLNSMMLNGLIHSTPVTEELRYLIMEIKGTTHPLTSLHCLWIVLDFITAHPIPLLIRQVYPGHM
jgi:hypothetical protein